MITVEDLRRTVEVLDYYCKKGEQLCFTEEDAEHIEKTLKIIKSELNNEEDMEAHSEITVKMEQGKDTPLKEWARIQGISPATARQKAGRGGFKTAHKVGRDWMISEMEENPDGRRK